MPIYTRHIESALSWSGFSKQDQQKMRDVFMRLKDDSRKHINHFQRIRELVAQRY